MNEHPLLINPFDTDPEPHFRFDEVGNIYGNTQEGWQTIEVCGLDRKSLVFERKIVAQALVRHIESWISAAGFENEEMERRSLRELLEASRSLAPYAGMVRYLLLHLGKLNYRDLLELEKTGLL